MSETRVRNRRHTPAYQLGTKAIVLGAREGNIGGAIAERLAVAGWIAYEDDCAGTYVAGNKVSTVYTAPQPEELQYYDACIITLGVTHMEPFDKVSQANLHKVLYGSLELPLECARRYVKARKQRLLDELAELPTESHGEMTSNGFRWQAHPNGLWGKWMRAVPDKILFVGSYAYEHPFTHCTSYCVAKAGLDMAARSLAWELMPEGFDVHIIHPHHVQGTPMTEDVQRGMMDGVHKMTAEEAEAYSRKDLRMPDILKPCEIAEVVLWLLTNKEARWLSGSGLKLYGGVR